MASNSLEAMADAEDAAAPPAGAAVDAGVLGAQYIGPFSGLPASWRPCSYVVLRIGPEDFQPARCQRFGDLRPGCAALRLLYCLAAVIERKDMGEKTADPHYLANSVPKTVQIIEELVGDADADGEDGAVAGAPQQQHHRDDTFRGFHVWVLCNDPQYDIAKGFADLIEANARRRARAAAQRQWSSSTKPIAMPAHGDVDSVEALGALCAEYAHDPNYCPAIDALHAASQAVTAPDAKINPYRLLTAERAFALSRALTPGVCAAQCDARTYFNPVEGAAAQNFLRGEERTFPVPARTYRVKGDWFRTEGVRAALLPNALRNMMAQSNDDAEQCRTRCVQLRRELDDVDLLSDDERQQLDTDTMVAEERLRSAERRLERDVSEARDKCDSVFVDIEQRMKNRDVFARLADTNRPRVQEIRERHAPGTPEFKDAMARFRERAIDEWWLALNTSDDVTDACKSVRAWFERNRPEERWVDKVQITPSLSPYGNMVASMMAAFDKVMLVDTNFRLVFLAHLVGKGAYRYSWDLRAHLMITGDGSTGKSYVFDTVAQMSAPGTVQAITHETMQARQTDTDNSDCTMVFHEMPGRMLGVDQYGNQTSADSFLKDRLTRSMSVTSYIAIDKDSGERATKTSVARCMNATMGASNEKAPPGDSALMQRYLRWRMTRQSRPGMTAHEQMFMPEWATDPELRPHVVHGAQLHDTFLFFVEKAIHAGVLPDVNVDVARHVAQRVFAEMEKDAVPAPRPRLINVYLSLCRTATLWYAIHMELFSEMGAHHRVDARTGQSREFSPRMLIDVAKWFVCTRECAVHVLTLLEPVIMPGLREEIARAIGFAMVHGRSAAGGPPAGGDPAPAGAGAAAAGDGGDHRHAEFHPVLPSVGGAGTDFRRRRGPGGSDIVDYDYISLQGATVRAIAALIAGKIGNRPSATDVLSTLYEMQQEVIMVQPRHVAGTADAPRVEVNAAVPSRLIACAILEDCDHGRGKSVSIAIDMVNRTYGGTMRRCIVRALQNSKQRACRLITGMPYVRRDRATDLEGRVHEEVFYQVADVIELRRTDELHIVPNPFAFTCAEVSALYGHTRVGAAAASGAGPSALQQQAGWRVDEDIDWVTMGTYWTMNGFDLRDSKHVYPGDAHKAVWFERDVNPRYRALRERVINRYPEDYAEEIVRMRRQLQDMKHAASEDPQCHAAAARLPRYSDLYRQHLAPEDRDIHPLSWDDDDDDVGAGAADSAPPAPRPIRVDADASEDDDYDVMAVDPQGGSDAEMRVGMRRMRCDVWDDSTTSDADERPAQIPRTEREARQLSEMMEAQRAPRRRFLGGAGYAHRFGSPAGGAAGAAPPQPPPRRRNFGGLGY